MTDSLLNRRQVLAGGAAAAMAVGASKSTLLRKQRHALVKAAASTRAAGSDLGAVEHVVFLMQENRSFDHYFGTLGGVNGFDALPQSLFAQPWPGGADPKLLPFHLDTSDSNAECTYDLSHQWQAQHACWNGGAMDSFVSTHVSNTYEGGDYGTQTMGYYDSADIPFYYDLVKNFTVCDNYFCSVLGPTHPNRLMQMSGTLDPAGTHGGPILVTNSDKGLEFTCTWTTMPEILQEMNVSWKVYNPHGTQYRPREHDSMLLCKNPLMYFKQYQRSQNKHLFENAFNYYGPNVPDSNLFSSIGPNSLAHDVKRNRLPAVSWVVAPDGFDEHPPAPPALGEWYTAQVLATLMSNPEVWKSTVLFIMYDENDGYFDHVAPPTPPPNTPGEFITKHPLPADAAGVAGPVGFGFRVPMIVVSPFSASTTGGWVCSDVLDHTSQLQFISERWGVPVPNVSAWRRATAGNLTGALPMLATPRTAKPLLPATSESTSTGVVGEECSGVQIAEINLALGPYPIPATQTQPTQGPNTLTPTPA
ncbi:MAG TPA: alkaline phosphatase family protein [Acidimicrobiales bacterium]